MCSFSICHYHHFNAFITTDNKDTNGKPHCMGPFSGGEAEDRLACAERLDQYLIMNNITEESNPIYSVFVDTNLQTDKK